MLLLMESSHSFWINGVHDGCHAKCHRWNTIMTDIMAT